MTCGNRLLFAACAALIGCTETIELTRDPLDQLLAVEITPRDAMIKLTDLAGPHHTLQYTAMGHFADGTTRDVTALAQWTIDNGRLGAFEARGVFVASHAAAGYATTTVDAAGLQATAALTVVIDATIIDSAFPPPAANLFDPAIPSVIGDALRSPKLIYPADGTVFPQNIASTLFQYQRGDLNDAFRITFESDVLHLAIESGADRWRADGTLQRLLAGTGIAGPIHSTIRAASSAAPGTVYLGNSITIDFAQSSPGGELFFWSAATTSIMRGGVQVANASKLDPSSTTCVGCHAVSRNGAEMAMGLDNTTSTNLTTIDIGTLTPLIQPSVTRPMGFATYSPDGKRLLVANNGVLTLYDSATGANLGMVQLPPMRYATHPDWSPDGAYVAVALATQAPSNMDVKAASIARIPYNDGAWGAPQIIVTGSSTNNNYFPRWSPDSKFLAYVRAAGASQGAISADMMLVSSTGGTPRPLRLANHRVGAVDDVPDLANTMPTWAPNEGDRSWLAFVSARAYGAVLPTAGRGQIWVTSLDLTRTGDPSTPAFWLPCQDVTVLNNNPVWSKLELTQ